MADINLLAPSQNPEDPSSVVPFQDPQKQVQDPQKQVDWPIGLRPVNNVAPIELPSEPQTQDQKYYEELQRAVFNRIANDEAQRHAREAQSFIIATKSDSELAGEAQRLGIQLDLDPKIVEQNIPKMRTLLREREFNLLDGVKDPKTRELLLNVDFAAIAGDKIPEVSFLEKSFNFANKGWMTGRQGILEWERVNERSSWTPQKEKELQDIGSAMALLPQDTSGQGLFGGLWYGLMQTTGQLIEAAPESFAMGALSAGTVAAATLVAAPIAPILEPFTASAAFGVGVLEGQYFHSAKVEGGYLLKTMREMGVNSNTASNYAAVAAPVLGLLEAFGFHKVTGIGGKEIMHLVRDKVARDLVSGTQKSLTSLSIKATLNTLKNTGYELGTELSQEFADIITEQLAVRRQKEIDPSKIDWKVVDDNSHFVDRLADIAAETIRGTLLLASMGPMMSLKNDLNQVRNAEKIPELLKNIREGIVNTTLDRRSPSQLAKALTYLADGSKVENIYFKPEEFETALRDARISREQLLEISPEISKAYEESVGSPTTPGTGMVEIPMHTWGSKFLSSEIGESLAQHARIDVDGLNISDIRSLNLNEESIVTQAEKILTEKEKTDKKFSAEVGMVRKDMATQLMSAGRTKSQANSEAEFYSKFAIVYSQYEKMSPSEWHKTHGQSFVSREKDNVPTSDDMLSQDVDIQSYAPSWLKENPSLLKQWVSGELTDEQVVEKHFSLSRDVGAAVQQNPNDMLATITGVSSQSGGLVDGTVRYEPPVAPATEVSQAETPAAVAPATAPATSKPTAAPSAVATKGVQTKEKLLSDLQSARNASELARHNFTKASNKRIVAKRVVLSPIENYNIAESADKHGISVKEIEKRVREQKKQFPTTGPDAWDSMVFVDIKFDEKGKWEPKYKAIPYSFNRDANNKGLEKGTKEYSDRVNALAARLTEEVKLLRDREKNGDLNAKNILSQNTWYREFRSKMRRSFGGLGDMFADLLGGASPNTEVPQNWSGAIDALTQATRGDFDKLFPEWIKWNDNAKKAESEFGAWLRDWRTKANLDELETEPDRVKRIEAIDNEVDAKRKAYEEDRKAKDPSLKASDIRKEDGWKALNRNEEKAAIRKETSKYTDKALTESAEYQARFEATMIARELPKHLVPKKMNGALYGFNGENIVKALIGTWRTIKEVDTLLGRGSTAPKALNFSGNLIGFRKGATIDVWAARMLNRLAGRKRVPTNAENGVAGTMLPSGETTGAFGMGQDVFAAAAKLIRNDKELDIGDIQADDLQAVVWFLEKEIWAKNNWSPAEGGSFEFELALSGVANQKLIAKHRSIANSKLSTPQQKKESNAYINSNARAADLFIGMQSAQTSPGWQGKGHVPTDQEQSQLQQEIHTAILESDSNASVVALKVNTTKGMYGSEEEVSIEMEFSAREGFDATLLWQKMLKMAMRDKQDAIGLSRVLRENEPLDYSRHRPGVEIYFQDGKDFKSIIEKLVAKGINNYTVITDLDIKSRFGKDRGAMAPMIGIRFQFSPEMEARFDTKGVYDNISDQELADLVKAKFTEYNRLSSSVEADVDGILSSEVLWYETQVAFNGRYQDKINANTTRASGRASAATAQGIWTGQSSREGVASAIIRREAALQGAVAESGPDGERSATSGDGSVLYNDSSNTQEVAQPAEAAQQGEALNSPTGRGSYFPTLRLGVLEKKADSSTVIHEMSHFFFMTMVRVASQQNAPLQVREDLKSLLSWFAKTEGGSFQARWQKAQDSIALWNSLSHKEQERFHEALAYNFEVYMFEGKAPSPELNGLFARIRTWMIAAYRNIRDELNQIYRANFGTDLPMLTPEVRMVFDRMVASEEAIEQAESVRHMLPLYQTEAEFVAAGFTSEQWNDYQKALQAAHEAAVTDLTRASMSQLRWLKNARSRVLKSLEAHDAKIRSAVEEAVRNEVKQEHVYVALELLREANGKSKLSLEGVRLILSGLDEEARIAAEKKLGVGKRGVLAKSGADIDVTASILGYESGEQMVNEMLAARSFEEEVDARTDKEMLLQYDEFNNPANRELAMEEALHSEARARFIAVEQNFLTGSGKPVQVLLMAARFSAQRILDDRTVRSLRPDKYAQAEARAAREAENAIRPSQSKDTKRKAGDPSKAVQAKQRQLLNNQLASEAIIARKGIDKFIKWAKVFGRSNEKLSNGGYDVNIVNMGRWLLARVGLLSEAMTERTADYLEMLKKYNPNIFEAHQPMLARFAKGPFEYKDLTLSEFRAMMETVKILWDRAKRDGEIVIEGKREGTRQVVRLLFEQIAGDIPAELPGEVNAISKGDRVREGILGTKSVLTQVEHLFRNLDGDKQGYFLQKLFNPVSQSLDKYRVDASKFTSKLVNAVRALSLNSSPIYSPELNYTFKGEAELIGLLLHMGNKSNRERVLVGGRGRAKHSWAKFDEDGQIDQTNWITLRDRLIASGRLRKEHFDFAQFVWDMMEEIKPMLQEAHSYLEGYNFKEVEAEPFTIQYQNGSQVTYAGGYVPAVADRDLAGLSRTTPVTQESLRDDFNQGVPKVHFGSVKERVDQYGDRPLDLDVRHIAQHIDKAMLYAHSQPRISDALKIINGSFVDENGDRQYLATGLNRIHKNLVKDVLMPWLDRAATQSLYKPGVNKAWDAIGKFVLNNTGIALMMANPVNVLQQYTGISNSVNYVKAGYLAGGLKRYMSSPREAAEFIIERSDAMNDRLTNQMHRLRSDLDATLLNPGSLAQMQVWTSKKAYGLQAAVQNQVDIVTWLGAFDQAMATRNESETAEQHEKRAAAEGNSAVRLSQGSMNPEDSAAYQVGTPWYRAWMQFTRYMNAVLNQIAYSDHKVRSAILGFTIPTIISAAIAKVLYGNWKSDDPDKDKWMLDGWVWDGIDVFALSQVRGAAGMLPGVGANIYDFVDDQILGHSQFNNGRTASMPAISTLYSSAIGLIKLIKDAASDNKDISGDDVRDAMTFVTVSTGTPLVALGRPSSYLIDLLNDKVTPNNPVDALRGILTGRAATGTRNK